MRAHRRRHIRSLSCIPLRLPQPRPPRITFRLFLPLPRPRCLRRRRASPPLTLPMAPLRQLHLARRTLHQTAILLLSPVPPLQRRSPPSRAPCHQRSSPCCSRPFESSKSNRRHHPLRVPRLLDQRRCVKLPARPSMRLQDRALALPRRSSLLPEREDSSSPFNKRACRICRMRMCKPCSLRWCVLLVSTLLRSSPSMQAQQQQR